MKIGNNNPEKSLISKVIIISMFVITFFILIAIYTFLYARVLNTTFFFKVVDVLHAPLLSPILSILWLISVPIFLIIYYHLFFNVWFKKYKVFSAS